MSLRTEMLRLATTVPKLRKHVLQMVKASEEKLLATNRASWQWEYDEDEKIASVFLNEDTGALRLELREIHTKTGIGAGVRNVILEDESLGTILKPQLGKVASLLKKHSPSRSTLSSGFKRVWTTPDGKKESLGQILQSHIAETGLLRKEPSAEDLRATILQKVQHMTPEEVRKLYETLAR